MAEPHKSRAGMLLYRQLPEEYRYRDNRTETEWGDLEAYLDGFGVLLDRTRETLEQSYADAFAETTENGRSIQPWLIPYLADLLQAELLSPDPADRTAELNRTVGWYKSKGTLHAVDSIVDTVSGDQSVVVEGWKRTLVTPRTNLPPFTIPPGAGVSPLPLGTPDLREASRAVLGATGENAAESFVLPEDEAHTPYNDRIVYWKSSSRSGAPCFSGHFDDRMVRTPDVGDFSRRQAGPHPRRTHLHVQPPAGLFERGLATVQLDGPDPLGVAAHIAAHGTTPLEVGPRELLGLGDTETPPRRLKVDGELGVPAGAFLVLHDLLFLGKVIVAQGGRVEMHRAAANEVVLDKDETGVPMLVARDCLFEEIFGPASFAQLEYVTVLGPTNLARIWASDCVFAGDLVDFDCAAKESCIRYSRMPEAASGECAKAHFNTGVRPDFVELRFKDPDGWHTRVAGYDEPGAGVLASYCAPAVAAGAEDRGEMGAHHHLFYTARLRAARDKLGSFLPVGQTISLGYDERLAVRPPQLKSQ